MPDLQKAFGFWINLRRAAERSGSTLPRLLFRLASLRVSEGYDPTEALSSGLLDPKMTSELAACCVSKRRLIQLQARHNPQGLWRQTEDKGVFYRRCIDKGIPCPGLFGILDESDGWISGGGELRTEAQWVRFLRETVTGDFVIKPSFGAYGQGVDVFSPNGTGFQDPRGKQWTSVDIFRHLQSDKKYFRFVIQPRLRSHSSLERLSGSNYLQTVRLVTYVNPDGDVQTDMALFKMIVGANTIDNFVHGLSGNFASAIDIEKGALLPAFRITPDRMGVVGIARHPDTGMVLEGFQLPFWGEALSLVRRAALSFLPLRTLGWDIALTPAGPLIVEGNMWWDPFNFLYITPPVTPTHKRLAGFIRRLATDTPPKKH